MKLVPQQLQIDMLQTLTQSLASLPNCTTLWIAYSGGLDSHCLLNLIATCSQLRERYQLKAVHIHHGLSKNADFWAEHCQRICENLHIDCQIIKVTISGKDGKSLEEKARNERYQAFKQLILNNDCLLSAHHQDDQAETLLLQLLRGAGPKGMASMAELMPFSSGYLLRPLLNFSRSQLQDYANVQQLKWIEDESNAVCDFDRNYLRQVIIPQLRTRWPGLSKTLARSARHCATQELLVQDLAQKDFLLVQKDGGAILDQQAVLARPVRHQLQVLRYWFSHLSLPLPSEIKLQQVIQDVFHSRYDATPCVKWKGVELRRYRHSVYAFPPLQPFDKQLQISWDGSTPLVLPGDLGNIEVTFATGPGLLKLHLGPFSIRFRQNGERFQPAGRNGSQSLKKLMQEWGIPPWLRDRIPLLYVGETLAAVVGYCVADSFATGEGEAGIFLGAPLVGSPG